jgi:hypothetical protein
MANLRDRADELRSQGLTKHRAFRMLRREFPHAERDSLVRAAQLPGAPTGYFPPWAQRIGLDKNRENSTIEANGAILHPVVARRPPGGTKK